MFFSIKASKRILRHTYKQLALLWFVYIALVVMGALFVSSVVDNFLEKGAESLLANLQSRVSSDLLESETALRSASLNINRLLTNGASATDVQDYIREFNQYVLAKNRRITGVDGLYGIFHVFGGAFIDETGQISAQNNKTHLDRPWYKEAIDARGEIAISSPHYDETIGGWKITFSRQLTGSRGRTLAVMGLDMRLDVLSRYFSSTHLSEGDYCFMIDDQFNIVAASARETIGQPLSVLKSPDIYTIIAALNKGDDIRGFKTVQLRADRSEPVIAHSRKIENGWHVGLLTSAQKYNDEVYASGFFIIICGTIFQLVISLVVFRIAAAKLKSEEKNEQKSSFLANMSHEIRTPMNAIIGFAELALREDIPPAAYEHIFTIKQAGANLLSIINDILDYSKIESGKMEIVQGDYMFSSLVNDVVSIIKMRATYSRLRFVVNVDSGIPNSLVGDEVKVRQILLNLLSNAVKYTEKGFVSLNITGQICHATENTVDLKIEVADSGKGIKKEDINKLFKDYAQVDKSKNKGIEGTGLGLVITNNILTAMEGSITVESEYGKGSVFTVELPQKFTNASKHANVNDPENKNVLVYERREIYANSIIRTLRNLGVNCTNITSESEFDEMAKDGQYDFIFTAPIHCERAKRMLADGDSNAKLVLLTEFGDTIPDLSVTIVAMPAYSVTIANILNGTTDAHYNYGSPKDSFAKFIAPDARILVVDDTNTNLRVAEGLLAPYKMRVTLCKSGPEAIDAVQSEHFDIVFMDHMMPGMDGIEATKHIREMSGSYYQNLPIIALTANAVAGAREMFLNEGCNDFISKPIDVAKLNSVLDKWIPLEKRKLSDANLTMLFECKQDGEEENIIEKLTIDGVDINKGIILSGGNVEYYMRAITMFYEDGFEKIREIKRCLEMEELHLYATHVHGLKSAAASIGAVKLAESASKLETAGKEKNLVYIKNHTSKFLLELESLLRNIGRVLNNMNAKKSGSVDKNILIPELIKLKNALDAFNSEAIDDAIKAMQEYENSEECGSDIKNLLQNVLIGEYDEALMSIDTMLSRLKQT